VRAAAETLPPELAGCADRVTVVLPWGSLRPEIPIVAGVRSLCRGGARLSVVLGLDPVRDRAEAQRLRLPVLDETHLRTTLAAGYSAAGFGALSVSLLAPTQLAAYPSSWAKRLAFGRSRPVYQIETDVR
jgi:hypothetical protein